METIPGNRETPEAGRAEGVEESFEAQLARLEEVVRRLESGEEPLAEVLRLFREGTILARRCAAQLDAAERLIERLVERPDGSVELEPFALGGLAGEAGS